MYKLIFIFIFLPTLAFGENYVNITGTNITSAENSTLNTWYESQILGRSEVTVSSIGYNPITQTFFFRAGGPTAQDRVSSTIGRLSAAIRAKLTRSNVSIRNSQVRTGASQRCSKPGRVRICN